MTLKEREKKVQDNLGLVHSCAKKFTGKGVDYEDIVAAGCIGLIKAIDNFDETRGLKLSTYAVPSILGEIKRIWRDGGSIKVSRKVKELSLKINRLNEESLHIHGKELSINELSLRLSVLPEDVTYALSSSRLPISLSACDDEDKEREIAIPVKGEEEEIIEKLSLEKAVKELTCLDKKLITLRYYQGKTQSETAKNLSMTQVQVSRREKKILATLRSKLMD